MGQALDKEGNVLGEATGNTKREVFDELQRRHPAADEIRIKTLEEKLRGQQAADITTEPMLQWFQYAHLPPHLQDASRPFCDLATKVTAEWPRNAERTVTLRKLLEAKDAAVRSLISK